MKSTGIVRKVDELGRVVLPIELRRILDIEAKDSLEIFVEGKTVVLRKYEPECVFCGEVSNVTTIKGKNVCSTCVKNICDIRYREL
jgi:transcriptional pleiotropic regulator of transition state genes